jgi:hypothetical protein
MCLHIILIYIRREEQRVNNCTFWVYNPIEQLRDLLHCSKKLTNFLYFFMSHNYLYKNNKLRERERATQKAIRYGY